MSRAPRINPKPGPAFRPFLQGLYMCLSGLGCRLPLCWHIPVVLACWALLLPSLYARCAAECSIPCQSAWY